MSDPFIDDDDDALTIGIVPPEFTSPDRATYADFIDGLQAQLPPLHPSAECVIGEWLNEARRCAYGGDVRGMSALLDLVRAKTAQELAWESEDAAQVGDLRTADALFARANEFAPVERRNPDADQASFEAFVAEAAVDQAIEPHPPPTTEMGLPLAASGAAGPAMPSVISQPEELPMTQRPANVPPWTPWPGDDPVAAANAPLQQDQALSEAAGGVRPAPSDFIRRSQRQAGIFGVPRHRVSAT
jgi:hypothetical protein